VRSIPVIVDNCLRVDGNLIGHDLTNQIFDELEIPNDARVKAERANRWGWWELPEFFQLSDLIGDTVVMPRGYALQLKLLLRENNIKVVWVDRRKWRQGKPFVWRNEPDPRFKHQARAVKLMRKHEQGIYEAPTGSGKMVTCMRFIHDTHPAHTIILVDRIDLMNQWIAGFDYWLGLKAGQIGDGQWIDSRRVNVATVQTIWSAMKKGKDDLALLRSVFFRFYDNMIIDECHHVSAETIQFIVTEFWARMRIGPSATPDRVDGKFEVTQAVLGEVFHKDDENELRKLGIIVKPHVEVVRTNFKFTYWPDHQSNEKGECKVPGCSIKRPHGHRNNYQGLKDKLVHDDGRNQLICETIEAECQKGQHHHLVISDEVRHLEALYSTYQMTSLTNDTPEMFMLTGRIKGKDRKTMVERIKQAPSALVFATVAKEGLDIPPIDRVYLVFPNGNAKVTQQKIGRGSRSHPGKKATVIFDFLDNNVSILKGQFRNRRYKCYDKLNIDVSL